MAAGDVDEQFQYVAIELADEYLYVLIMAGLLTI